MRPADLRIACDGLSNIAFVVWMIRVSPSCFLAGLLRVSASPLCAIEFLKLTCFVAQNRSEVVSRNAPKFTRNGEKNGKSVGKVVLVPN